MLDHLARIIKPKNIHPRIVVVARPMLKAMQHDKVALGNGPLDLDPFARPFARHALEIGDEPVLAVGDMGIVLRIGIPRVAFDRGARLTVVEHHLVERDDIRFVALKVGQDSFNP